MRSRNFTLAGKLWLAVTIVALIFVVGLTTISYRTNGLIEKNQIAIQKQTAKINLATKWVGLVNANTARDLAILASTDTSLGDLFKPQIQESSAQISEIFKSISEQTATEEEKELLKKIADLRKAVIASRDKSRELRSAGKVDEAIRDAKENFQRGVVSYLAGLQEFASYQENLLMEMQKDFATARQQDTYTAYGVALIFTLLLVLGSYALIKQIRTPLRDVIEIAERISLGDLTSNIRNDRKDEFGDLLSACMNMQSQLLKLVSDVQSGTANIESASQEIAIGNQDLSNRTEQTASNLEETASSLEHLTSTVKESTEAAYRATSLAGEAATVAERGGVVVGQVTATMNEINQSSKKISEIISVIDGIAFQTNILALNAAVESARAGEHGRGFAVVASEVRSLASRSAEAAKEIKTLINASVEKVEAGSMLVSNAGMTMREIVNSVHEVSEIISQISKSAIDQSNELSQVNAAVTQLDQMTQQNAALVEESAAAASSMKDQALRLASLVDQFKIRDTNQKYLPLI